RINLPTSSSASAAFQVRDLTWHPELCDNMFACCVSDGSIFIIQVSDNSTAILSHIPSSGATCVCWSPKGKQIVVGYDDAHFSQFKHSNGQNMQEAKRTE